MFIERQIGRELDRLEKSPLGRCMILTGARQTGKTTLLRKRYGGDFAYYSFDEVIGRQELSRQPAAAWLALGRKYIFDEVQKAPDFLHTVKAILDQGGDDLRVLLSGSAQIQLLSSVNETLAGRSVARELFPLTVNELAGVSGCLLTRLLECESTSQITDLLRHQTLLSQGNPEAAGKVRNSLDHILSWGGMPALCGLPEESDRWIWLEEYCRTYLQRDLADLGRVADLDNFLRLERLAALRTAGVLNYADLARDADLSAVTTKKYLHYLTLSYQAFLLEPFRHRRKERLVKAPKLHWLDMGVQRVLSGLRSGMTGQQFESAMVAEIYKICRTLRLPIELMYLRTKDGREVDLLTRLANGDYIAWEMKAGDQASPHDARHFRGLERLLDVPLLAGLVIYNGQRLQVWEPNLFAVPAALLFG